jgi:hypothetical protein
MPLMQQPSAGLNEIQLSLLRLFSRPMSEKETKDLKKLLVGYYSVQLEKEVSKVVAEKGYSQKDFDNMLNSES